MNGEEGGSGSSPEPLRLADIWAIRTDFEDVPVEQLGGRVVRVYALTGTARAKLVPSMADLANSGDSSSPENVERIMLFQSRVVAASLGFKEAEWGTFGETMGSEAIEALYEHAAKLSGLDGAAQTGAQDRLKGRRKVGSGTG